MARKRAETTLDQITRARVWLGHVQQYPQLLQNADLPEQLENVRVAFEALVDFRNMVRNASEMQEDPKEATRRYLDT